MIPVKIILIISFTALAACGSRSDAEYVRATDIDFECSVYQSINCDASAAGKTVYMGLSTDTNFDCEAELYNLDSRLFAASFDYSGATIAQDAGTYIWGVVTQWVNAAGGKTLQFEDTDYKLCAFIDDNSNGRLDLFEVIAEQSFNPSQEFYPVTSWVEL